MRQEKGDLIKEVKGRNRLSNIAIALNVVFGAVPLLIVVVLVGMLMEGTMTDRSVLMGGAGIAACLALKAAFYGISVWKAHDAAYGALTDIRMKMVDHLRALPLGFFQKRRTGDLANIVNHDVEQVELYLAHALPEIMVATMAPAAAFLLVLAVDWRLGLALISTAPLMFLLMKFLDRRWESSIKHYSDSTKRMSEDLLEYISTIPVIKAYGREERRTRKVLDGMHDYIVWVKKATVGVSIPMSIVAMMLESGLVLMVIVGSILLTEGQIGMQSFILTLILGGIFTTSFAKLATFQHYGIVLDQALEGVSSVTGVPPPERSGRHASAREGDIVVSDVCFGYNEGKETLSHINLTFKEGTVNAIVGPSGSGKTTLASLIMGFWAPDRGTITVGGLDTADMTEQALNGLVSMVQQDVFLFDQSIEDNIRIGRENATEVEIIEAAKRAQVHEFITSLPQGYTTRAGEAGAKLSGGERQRISIARMMLKNAPIMILDEATASVDPSNEQLIQKAISNLGERKTIIVIAHHLNTIVDADQIVVMDGGKVTATGTHEDLLSSCPQYAEMVEQQAAADSWQIREVKA